MDTDDSTPASNRPAAAREESANVKLAESLKPLVGRAFTVTAEVSGRADRKLPDLELRYGKLHIVLEAKYDDFDAAVEAAQNRWHEMQPRPDMVGAVSYAPAFRTDFEGAIRAAAPVEFALCGGPHQDLHAARRSGEIYDLAQALRRPYSVLSRDDDRIENAVNRIKGALAFFVDYVDVHPGMAEELAELLQAGRNGGDRRDAFSQSARMGGLIVFGAALFQIALAKQTSEVQSPLKMLEEQGVLGLRKHWRFIVEEINYHAIFRLAADILVLDVSKNAVLHLIERARSRSASCASPTRLAAPAPCWRRPRGSCWTTSRARIFAATAAASAASSAPTRAHNSAACCWKNRFGATTFWSRPRI